MSTSLSLVKRFKETAAELPKLTFSPLGKPGSLENFIKIPIWGTLGTGGLAIISGIFKVIIQERAWKAVNCHVLQASLASCATCATIVIFFVWKAVLVHDQKTREDFDKNFRNAITSFEAGISFGNLFSATLAYFIRNFSHHPKSLLAKHSITPFMYVGGTALTLWALQTLHARNAPYQDKKIEPILS
jgi:hypothetical protein